MRKITAILLIALAVLLVSISIPVKAADYLSLGGDSYHFVERPVAQHNNYNWNNLGIGWEHTDKDQRWSFSFGTYKNSLYRSSNYVYSRYTFRPEIVGAHVSVMMGAVTGYKLKVSPVVLPALCWKYACTAVVPPVPGIRTPVLLVNWRIQIK